MSRRITFSIVDDTINSQKAVQPKEDDLAMNLLSAILADLEHRNHEGVTVIHVSATKEVIAGATDSSKADHKGTHISLEQYPHETVDIDKGAVVGNEATR